MRVLIALFSMYIMALSLMPCTDMGYTNLSLNSELIANDFQEINHSHSAEEDSCSPFCACSCCGAVYVPAMHWSSFSFSPSGSFDSAQHQPHYISLFIPNCLDSIWQPPKIRV